MASRILFLLLALMYMGQLLHAQRYNQELWYSAEKDGTRFGTLHVRVSYLSNGYREIRAAEVREGVTTDRREIEMRITSSVLIDTGYHPVSLVVTSVLPEGTWSLKASYSDGVLFSAITGPDGRTERRRTDAETAIPDIALPLYFAGRNEAPGYPLPVLDTRSPDVRREQLHMERDDGHTTWTLGSGEVQNYVLDGNGVPVSIRYNGLTYTRMDTQSAIRPNGRLALHEQYTWSFRSANKLSKPGNIASMTVMLACDRGMPDLFDFRDRRQEVLETRGDSVQLRISATRNGIFEEKAPILGDRYVDVLKDTRRVQPSSADVQRLASSLRGERRNAYEIAALYMKWTSEYIAEDPFAAGTGASAILRSARGTATERAVAFVSLCRSAGIPARFALGQRFVMGAWRSHVWSEIWVGEWVPVDPTAGVPINDPTYIKCIEVPSIDDLPLSSADLDGSLRMNVQSISTRDNSAAGDIVTGVYGSTYRNREYQCSVEAPGEDWIVEERRVAGRIIVDMRPEINSPFAVELILFPNLQRIPAEDLLESRITAQQGILTNFQVEEHGEMTLQGIPAPYVVASYTGSIRGVETEMRVAVCTMAYELHAYQVSFAAPVHEFEVLRDQLEHVFQSFTLYR